MNRRTEKLVSRFETRLCASDFHPLVKEKTSVELRRRVEEWCSAPENCDGRGTRASVLHDVRRTLNQLVNAVRHAHEHENSSVRRDAKALIRAAQSLSFDCLQQRSSQFVGKLNRAGHIRNENRLKESRPTFTVAGLEVTELTSQDQLKSEGRQQELCFANNEFGDYYLDALKHEQSKFYRLAENGKAIGVLQLDVETMTVEDVKGPGNKTCRLSRKQAIGILRKLRATADEVDDFSRVGAFSVFLDGKHGEPSEIRWGACSYYVWCFREKNKLVIRRTRLADGKRKSSWSLFSRQRKQGRARRNVGRSRGIPNQHAGTRLREWDCLSDHRGALSMGKFFDLLLQCPEMGKTVRIGFSNPAQHGELSRC